MNILWFALGALTTWFVANQVVRRLRDKLHHEELTSLRWLHYYENAADDAARLEGDLKRTDDTLTTAVTTKNAEIARLTKERDAAREGTEAVFQSYFRATTKIAELCHKIEDGAEGYDILLERLLDAEEQIADLKTRVIQ